MSAPSETKVAFLVANEGIEEIELTSPWAAVQQAGHTPVLVSLNAGTVQTYHAYDKASTYPVDRTVDEVKADEFAAVVLPGGVGNPDELRLDDRAVALVRDAAEAGLPVAAICHAGWTLAEAGVVSDRQVTSWKSIRTDLVNAGADWQDRAVIVDRNGAGPLITSRNPDDLEDFNREILAALGS